MAAGTAAGHAAGQSVGPVVGRNIRNVGLGGPIDRDRLGRILDAGHIGSLDLTFVRSLYLLVIISSVTLTFAEFGYHIANPLWPLLTCVVVFFSHHRLVRRKPAILGRWVGNLLSTLAIFKLVLDVSSMGTAIMTAVGSLLSLLIWIKLLQNKRNRDFVQILLLSFGQMLVSAVLTQELWFGVSAMLYLLGTTWVLLLFHFKREGDGDFHPLKEQIVDWRMFRTGQLISRTFLGILVMALILTSLGTFLVFISLPRVTSGWLNSLLPAGNRPSTGLTDRVALGGTGTINRDQKTAMFAEWDERPGWDVLYRAVVQEDYDPDSHIWSTNYGDPFVAVVPWDAVLTDGDTGPAGSIRCQITDVQQPRSLRQLATPGIPLWRRAPDGSPRVAARLVKPEEEELEDSRDSGVIRTDGLQRSQVDYVVRVAPPVRGTDYESAPALPALREYTPGPEHRAKLKQWTRDHMGAENVPGARWTVRDIHNLMEALTAPPYTYTLEQVPPPPGEDPILHFLLERKKGHCEYFASALCMILRAWDVDARMVTGFAEGPTWRQDEDSGTWLNIVTYACAHAWVEVHIENYGWQPFNPSPEVGAMPEPMSDWDSWIAAMQYRWRKHVVQFDLAQQLGILRWVKDVLRDIRDGVTSLGREVSKPFGQFGENSTIPLVIGSVVVAVPLVLLIILYRRWRARRRPKKAGRRSSFEPLQELFTLLERRGVTRPPSQTAAEFIRGESLGVLIPDPDREQFLRAYHAARYGGSEVSPDQQGVIQRVLTTVRDAPREPAGRETPADAAPETPPSVERADAGSGSS